MVLTLLIGGDRPLSYAGNNGLNELNSEPDAQKQLQTYRKALTIERLKADYQ